MSGAALERSGGPRPSWRLLLERERRVTTAALLLIVAAAWLYLLAGAGMPEMGGMDPGMVMAPTPWSAAYATAIFLMWWVMMAAMMLPSAAPAILLYDLVARRAQPERGAATLAFASGYLMVWGGFSAAAAALHWVLDQSGLLTMAMGSASAWLGGAVLIAAGAWQLTPVKRACLARCQSPIQFLAHRWRPGRLGPLRMGLQHGLHCLGCCWLMMGLLFYGGVMNPLWVGGLALYVLAEKSAPAGNWMARISGWVLILAGAASLATAM
jgi:predicted metal-binding membrane protein